MEGQVVVGLRPTRHDMLMGVAEVVALRGTCNRLKVGAVISREGRVLSTGYNGPPSGLPHCAHDQRYLAKDSCSDAVHAEANAVAFAARFGVATEAADLYVTHSPCVTCAKLMINAGLSSVYFRIPFRDVSGIHLLASAGVSCFKFDAGNSLQSWTEDAQ